MDISNLDHIVTLGLAPVTGKVRTQGDCKFSLEGRCVSYGIAIAEYNKLSIKNIILDNDNVRAVVSGEIDSFDQYVVIDISDPTKITIPSMQFSSNTACSPCLAGQFNNAESIDDIKLSSSVRANTDMNLVAVEDRANSSQSTYYFTTDVYKHCKLAVFGTYDYLACYVDNNSDGFELRILNKTTNLQLSKIDITELVGNINDIEVKGNTLYIAGTGGLISVNVGNPEKPVVSNLLSSKQDTYNDLFINGNYIYAGGNKGITIFPLLD